MTARLDTILADIPAGHGVVVWKLPAANNTYNGDPAYATYDAYVDTIADNPNGIYVWDPKSVTAINAGVDNNLKVEYTTGRPLADRESLPPGNDTLHPNNKGQYDLGIAWRDYFETIKNWRP